MKNQSIPKGVNNFTFFRKLFKFFFANKHRKFDELNAALKDKQNEIPSLIRGGYSESSLKQ